MRLYSHRDRAFHLGPLALEALARVPSCEADHTAALPSDQRAVGPAAVAHVLGEYFDLFRGHLTGPVAAGRAPIPDDPALRAANLKASAYFLDASIVGGCRMEAGDWLAEPIPGHTHALVILVEFGREPHVGDPGEAWIAGSNSARTDLRATELAVVLSGYLRRMGFSATGHAAGASSVHLVRLAQRAGVARTEAGRLAAPYLNRGFRLSVVTTELTFEPDCPLDPEGALTPGDPEVVMGRHGTRPAWWDAELEQRHCDMLEAGLL
jgi:hypothetical protein